MFLCQTQNSLPSYACGIEVPGASNIVITGGIDPGSYNYVTRVVAYTAQGTVTHLPSLRTKRCQHACSYYHNNNDKLVNNQCSFSPYMTGLLHEGIFYVGGLIKPAIFGSSPWAYVMCKWAEILICGRD